MPIKPMDMQVMLPNIKRAARAENAKLAKEETAMQQQQVKDNKDVIENQNKVSNLERKDQNEIKNDQKEHQETPQEKKKRKEKEEAEKEVQMKAHGSTFDLKV